MYFYSQNWVKLEKTFEVLTFDQQNFGALPVIKFEENTCCQRTNGKETEGDGNGTFHCYEGQL